MSELNGYVRSTAFAGSLGALEEEIGGKPAFAMLATDHIASEPDDTRLSESLDKYVIGNTDPSNLYPLQYFQGKIASFTDKSERAKEVANLAANNEISDPDNNTALLLKPVVINSITTGINKLCFTSRDCQLKPFISLKPSTKYILEMSIWVDKTKNTGLINEKNGLSSYLGGVYYIDNTLKIIQAGLYDIDFTLLGYAFADDDGHEFYRYRKIIETSHSLLSSIKGGIIMSTDMKESSAWKGTEPIVEVTDIVFKEASVYSEKNNSDFSDRLDDLDKFKNSLTLGTANLFSATEITEAKSGTITHCAYDSSFRLYGNTDVDNRTWDYCLIEKIDVEKGKEYTFTIFLDCRTTYGDCRLMVSSGKFKNTGTLESGKILLTYKLNAANNDRYSITFVAPASTIYVYGKFYNSTCRLQLEYGNKGSDWKPSYKDLLKAAGSSNDMLNNFVNNTYNVNAKDFEVGYHAKMDELKVSSSDTIYMSNW